MPGAVWSAPPLLEASRIVACPSWHAAIVMVDDMVGVCCALPCNMGARVREAALLTCVCRVPAVSLGEFAIV